jgi:hypothetical protein
MKLASLCHSWKNEILDQICVGRPLDYANLFTLETFSEMVISNAELEIRQVP